MRHPLLLSVLWLALGGGCTARSPDANTREEVISGYTAVLKSWDKDGDKRLSRNEVVDMVNWSYGRMAKASPEGRMTADLEKQRQSVLGFFASQDTNGDGYLSLDELLEGPLATFDCMDEDHDLKVSEEEVWSGMVRCPSVNLDDYAPRR